MRILIGASVVLATTVASAEPAKLTVTSNAFRDDSAIPVRFTCDGAAKAPTISWSAVPTDTKSIAVLVDDPDAEDGPFTHVLVTNIPADRTSLDLGAAPPAGANETLNDTGGVGYLAPCPQDGQHRYHYRVFALDEPVATAPANKVVTRASFLRGIDGHVLAEGDLVGVYSAR